MRVSAKVEYACVALVELAGRQEKRQPVSLKAIAEQYGISAAFLTQIFLQLKGAGIVASSRGSSGGYHLSKAPEDITMADIVETIDGPPPSSSALGGLPASPVVTALQSVLLEAQRAERKFLEEITLADLSRQSHEAGVMFYQI